MPQKDAAGGPTHLPSKVVMVECVGGDGGERGGCHREAQQKSNADDGGEIKRGLAPRTPEQHALGERDFLAMLGEGRQNWTRWLICLLQYDSPVLSRGVARWCRGCMVKDYG